MRLCKKIWEDKRGVSPVIATILMVAITVVLAGVLIVYLQQFQSGGQTVETQLGMDPKRVNQNWTISIVQNSHKAADLTWVVKDEKGSKVAGGDADTNQADLYTWNDNNNDQKLNPPDTIYLVYVKPDGTKTGIEPGMTFELYKGSNNVGSITLPS